MKHLALFLVPLTVTALSSKQPVPAMDRASIVQLIDQLGHDEFQERENAARRLLDLDEIPLELREAMESSDAEVRRRAEWVVDKIEHKIGPQILNNSARLIENGEFDQAVERLVLWASADPEGKSLRPLSRVAGKLLDTQRRRIQKSSPRSSHRLEMWDRWGLSDLLSTKNPWNPWSFRSSRGHLVQRRSFVEALRASKVCVKAGPVFAACSGDVAIAPDDEASALMSSVIFACGSVTLMDVTLGVVIVSDGDIEVKSPEKSHSLKCSLLIARGDITLPEEVTESTVIAGGRVKLQGQRKRWTDCTIREHDLDGLGIIKFFDPKIQGIEVTEAKDGVRVKAVAKDKPFATVLRAGDVISLVNWKATTSPEIFRKVLRAALAEERRQLLVTIRRSGEMRTVRVPMKR